MKKQQKTKVELLLELLSDAHWHEGDELANKVSWRFGDTVHKARKQGYDIKRQQEGSKHKYRWLRD